MAHSNIKERRRYVQIQLSNKKQLTFKQMGEIAELFNCSPSAIRADIYELTRDRNLPTPHVSHNMRQIIRSRDGQQCQYCGSIEDLHREYVVEHIIPTVLGGVGRAYNLVVSCQRCNIKKRNSVWIPRNLETITENYPKWKLQIVSLATPNQPICFDEQRVDKVLVYEYCQQLLKEAERSELHHQQRQIVEILESVEKHASTCSKMIPEIWLDKLRTILDEARHFNCNVP